MNTILHIVPAEFPEELIRYLFSFICHQDGNILVSLGGHQLPLCPRCIGLHTGFFLVVMITRFFPDIKVNILNPRIFAILVIVVTLAGIHWLIGAEGLINSDTAVRLLTGFLSGGALSLLLTGMMNTVRSQETNHSHHVRIFTLLYTAGILIIIFSPYRFLLICLFIIVILNITIVIRSLRTAIRLFQNPEYIRGKTREVQ